MMEEHFLWGFEALGSQRHKQFLENDDLFSLTHQGHARTTNNEQGSHEVHKDSYTHKHIS